MFCTKDESLASLDEAAVLGQLREQKPSASSEGSLHWIWLEEKDGIETASLCERIASQVTLLLGKFARFMEILEEKVRPLQRICSKGNHLVEAPQEEEVPLQVQSWLEKSVAFEK